jgi:hypothetical protein
MPKYLQLGIPEPCHEDWNKMSADAQGRFCGSCQKTVTDFTNMSDAQLIAFFKSPKTSVCGRFNQEQLERDILIPRKRIPWIKYFFQFTLPAFLLSLKSSAQIGKVAIIPPAQKLAVERPAKLLGDTITVKKSCLPVNQLEGRVGGISYSFEDTRNISGRVTDINGNPLAGASVSIKGTNNVVTADGNGDFLLVNVRKKATVMASYVGFNSIEVFAYQGLLNIQLTPQLMGEVVVVAGGIRASKKSKKNEPDKVCAKPEVTPTLTIYPNPVQRTTLLHLNWENIEAGNYRIEIFNAAGVLTKAQKFILEKGLKQKSLTINELSAGNYFLRLINEKTGKQISEKFIVQE